MSASATGLVRAPWIEMAPAVEGAVDLFDAAARLESRGIGDAAAIRDGHRDIFSLADACLVGSPPPSAHGTAPTGELRQALVRSVVMLCGVAICLMLIPTGGWSGTALASGAAGWLGGQAVSASLWWGKGAGREVQGSRGALMAAAVITWAAGIAAITTGEVAILGWAVWGWTAAVAVTRIESGRLAMLSAASSAIALAALALPSGRSLPAAAVVLLAGGWATWELIRQSRGVDAGGPGSHHKRQVQAICFALIQTVAHLYFLMLLCRELGGQFPIVMLAGLASTASCEPFLELASSGTRQLAASHQRWKQIRFYTALAGALTIPATGTVGLQVAVVASLVSTGGLPTSEVLSSAMAVSVMTSGCGVLLRTGSASGAAALAIAGAGVATLGRPTSGWPTMLAVAVACVLISAIAARRFASPRSW